MVDSFNNNQIDQTIIVDSKSFEERIAIELYRAVRNKSNLSLMQVGAQVKTSLLSPQDSQEIHCQVVSCINKNIRNLDAITYGEHKSYLVMLADTDVTGAKVVAERILDDIKTNIIQPINAYIGIASYPKDCTSFKELLQASNYAMLKARDMEMYNILTIAELREGISWKHEINPYVEYTKDQFNRIIFVTAGALLATLPESKRYIESHSIMTAKLAVEIAKLLKLPKEEVETLALAAILHDIGNINVPQEILNKPEKLDYYEREEIYKHPEYAVKNIIKDSTLYNKVAGIIIDHHENWDGSGYPLNKKEREINIGARIIAVADSFVALISERPYRRAYTYNEALAVLEQEVNIKFDRQVFLAFKQLTHHPLSLVRLLDKNNLTLSSIIHLVNC